MQWVAKRWSRTRGRAADRHVAITLLGHIWRQPSSTVRISCLARGNSARH